MRHNVKGRKLGRTASHRKATLNSLMTSLLKYKRIKTTLAKAKETRGFAEKLVTKARKGDLHAKKQVMKSAATDTPSRSEIENLSESFFDEPIRLKRGIFEE